jgi:hypothetical protein
MEKASGKWKLHWKDGRPTATLCHNLAVLSVEFAL